MSWFGKELIESAQEAVEIAKGSRKAAARYDFRNDRIDVAAIRKKVGASQIEFARQFGLAAATVRDWEQKRRVPDRMASAYLRVIEHAPDMVKTALAGAPIQRRKKSA